MIGRTLVADYDPLSLPDDERQRLHELAQQYPSYFVLVDLRGAGQPLRAWIKLRSLTAVLEAVAAGDAAGLRVTDRVDAGVPSLVSVRFEGREYSVPVDVDGRNPIAFGVLSRVYQMAVAELATPAVPPITIAK